MKRLALLVLSLMFVSCASNERQIASEKQQDLQKFERVGEYGPGYTY